jgi:hypothetical protein
MGRHPPGPRPRQPRRAHGARSCSTRTAHSQTGRVPAALLQRASGAASSSSQTRTARAAAAAATTTAPRPHHHCRPCASGLIGDRSTRSLGRQRVDRPTGASAQHSSRPAWKPCWQRTGSASGACWGQAAARAQPPRAHPASSSIRQRASRGSRRQRRGGWLRLRRALMPATHWPRTCSLRGG